MDGSPSALVLGKDGLRGRIEAPANAAQPVPTDGRIPVRLDNGQRILIPAEALTLQSDGSYAVPFGPTELSAANGTSGAQREAVLTIPVVEEELRVERRAVETGRTRIVKTVRERQETIDEPLMREEVAVEHVPINRVVEGPAPPVRYEGEIMVIPLLEEVFVVEKRLMLKEEVRIRRRQTVVHEPQTVTLRSEEVAVERVDPISPHAADRVDLASGRLEATPPAQMEEPDNPPMKEINE